MAVATTNGDMQVRLGSVSWQHVQVYVVSLFFRSAQYCVSEHFEAVATTGEDLQVRLGSVSWQLVQVSVVSLPCQECTMLRQRSLCGGGHPARAGTCRCGLLVSACV